MKHVFEADFLSSEKAFIFGKGPSFNQNVSIPEGCKIYCINQTALCDIHCDLAVCNDVEPLAELILNESGNNNIAFPYSIHRDEVPQDGHGLTVEAIFKHHVFTCWMYDLTMHRCKGFLDHSPIKAVSTYNVALAIALHRGAVKIYTNGIDGGFDRHELFKNTHQVKPPNYNEQFVIEKELLDRYKANVERVK